MRKRFKQIIKMVIIDTFGYILLMGIFLLFFYILPYELVADGDIVGSEEEMATFQLPDSQGEDNKTDAENIDDDISSDENNSKTNKQKNKSITKKQGGAGGNTNSSNTDTEDISANEEEVENVLDADITEQEIATRTGDNTSITITKKTYGSSSDKVTYYVAEIYVTSLNYLRTAFAEDTYGTNIKEDAITIADDNNAIIAITGDSYGNNDTGIVVRNGVLYRTDENEADVCILYTDGTMKTYTAEEFDEKTVLSDNVWQAWCFGPGLLDNEGNILSEFNSTSYISGNHPRAAIGCVEPGHYVFVIVDGRDEGYSRGVSITELAAIMKREGCNSAYNLDGCGSASMVFNDEYVNQSSSRDITDIIYVTE